MILKSWSRGHRVKLALLVAVPLGIYWMLAAQMSWRPRILIDLHQEASVQSLSLSPDGKRIVVFSDGRSSTDKPRVSVWTRDGGLMWQSDTPTSSVFSLHDGTMLSTGLNSAITLRDERTGRVRKTWVVNDPFFVKSVLSPDGKFLVCIRAEAALRVYDVSRITRNRPSVVHQFPQASGVNPSAFSPDSRTLAIVVGLITGNELDSVIQLWDTRTWKLKRTLKSGLKGEPAVFFSSDGVVMAIDENGRTKLWNPQNGKLLRSFASGEWPVTFSPDGKILASCTQRNIKLRDVRTGALLRELVGHRDEVKAIAFSPDGATLLSGSDDGTVRQWRIK